MNFNSKTAVVTGGASGIGFALVQELLREGANVVIADVEQTALDQALAALSDFPGKVLGVRTDVSKLDDVQNLAHETIAHFGAVHILCNNAGVETGGSFGAIADEAWRWVMDVNFFGVLNGCRVFLPLLEQHEHSHIVNTASVAAFASGAATMIPYCASKMAVLGLSESLDIELRSRNSPVSVSVLAPGPVKTRMTEAERNRPVNVPAAEEEERKAAIATLARTTEEKGLAPQDVARQVLEAIQDKRFFILTHPEIALNGVRTRLNWMETGVAPAPRDAGT